MITTSTQQIQENEMHIDYAKETIATLTNRKGFPPASDVQIIQHLATDEVVDLAAKSTDEKTQSIAKTMQESFGYRRVPSKGYKKITDKQRVAIAASLLEQYGSVAAVLAAAFDVSETEFTAE